MSSALVDGSVRSFLTSLGSAEPVPGGGAASALGAALAGNLFLMVASLTLQKEPDKEEALRPVHSRLQALSETCAVLVDRDAQAYQRVRDAYRLPKEHEDQRIKRAMEIELAMREAAAVPMELAEACVELLELGAEVLRLGRLSAISDAGTGGCLALAACMGGLLNVEVNLGSIDDPEMVERLSERVAAVQARSHELFERNQGLLVERLSAEGT